MHFPHAIVHECLINQPSFNEYALQFYINFCFPSFFPAPENSPKNDFQRHWSYLIISTTLFENLISNLIKLNSFVVWWNVWLQLLFFKRKELIFKKSLKCWKRRAIHMRVFPPLSNWKIFQTKCRFYSNISLNLFLILWVQSFLILLKILVLGYGTRNCRWVKRTSRNMSDYERLYWNTNGVYVPRSLLWRKH